ncbi:MAG: TonB-dependent receptor plug domain-containing protein [Opitutaceae bacterium]|nr:TonB-dependent receptor plug domain-containing protein [Opitutaceae bacterium]
MKHRRNDRVRAAYWLGMAVLPSLAFAQQTAPATPAVPAPEEEEIIELSPFEVNTDADQGYTASATLAGTRVRTDLSDLSSPLSVVTAKFLTDTGSRNSQGLLSYTTSTEVGGLYGNYGGFGSGQGLSESSALVRPNNNTRVRGLESADSTRNFFLSDIPWDSYNTDRIEIQRGPNSILFGVGSPSGIINNNTIAANLSKTSGKVDLETGSFGSVRGNFDYNHVIVKNLLAVRIAGLESKGKFRQKEAYNNDRRIYGTATFTPQLFSKDIASPLTIRVNAEKGDIKSRNPRVLPPIDKLSLWFAPADTQGMVWGMNKQVYDSFLMEAGGFGSAERGLNGSVKDAFYVPGYQAMDPGALNNGGIAFFYNNGQSQPIVVSRQAPRDYPFAIGTNGLPDGTAIAGFVFGSPLQSAGYNAYSKNVNFIDTRAGVPSRFPLADRNYYKDQTISDPSIFDFYNHLIDGRNGSEFNKWDSHNLSLSQGFLNNRIALEAVYDAQSFTFGRRGYYMDNPYLSVDANMNLMNQAPQYVRVPDPSGAQAQGIIDRDLTTYPNGTNPNKGRVFVAGDSGSLSNYSNTIDRESIRFTGTGEFRGSDVANKDSFLARAIGTHRLTGLWNEDKVTYTNKEWAYAATDLAWAKSLATSNTDTRLGTSVRSLTPLIYLTGDMSAWAGSTPSGMHLPNIQNIIRPAGEYSIQYFDSHWKHPLDPNAPGYVNPATQGQWKNLFGEVLTGNGGLDSAEAENPANYVGWTTKPGRILNADTGDIDQLTGLHNRRREITKSIGITWQANLLDDTIVPTYGWRRDRLKFYNGASSVSAEGVAGDPQPLQQFNNTVGETRSWGIVAKLPKSLARRLPANTRFDVYYNRGNNQLVKTRYNFDGSQLANPTAQGTDYGVRISTLDDRLQIKVGRFEVKSKNADLPGNASLIGQNQYYIAQLEAWGTAVAVQNFYGIKGQVPSQSWYWSWANVDAGFPGGDLENPNSAAFLNHPSSIKQRAAIKDMIEKIDQAFFDAYKIPVNVAAVKAAYAADDVEAMKAAFGGTFNPGGYTTGLNAIGDGNTINGVRANGTVDNLSKGWEVEINAKPVPNWDIQINVAKTDSSRSALGQPMVDFINKQYEKFSGPAGDLRIWWAGEKPIKKFYEDNILSAVQFQQESVGFQVPELRPWRGQLITTYSFQEGFLKNVFVGGGVRWEDKAILGYGLKADKSGLDVMKPLKGPSETSIDFWTGYSRKLTSAIDWKIQLNLRNVGQKVSLTPVSINPDGSYAAQRIREGMVWQLTNTFSF